MYYIGRAICRFFLCLFGRPKYIGTENIPESGGVILAPNHISHVDPPAVGSGIRRQVHFMAKDDLFRVPVLGLLINSVGAFPVKRGTADRKAVRRAIELLDEGRVICIFPEGKRSKDGNLQEPELGIGLIALKSRAPIVPVAVMGTDGVLPVGGVLPHFGRIKLVYGKPISFEDLYEKASSRESITAACSSIMAAIGELQKSHR